MFPPSSRHVETRALVLPLALLVIALVSPASASPTVSTSFEPAGDVLGFDLGGRFRYHVEASGGAGFTLESTLLLLDRTGNILRELPLEDGDLIQIHIRDILLVNEMVDGARWLVHAPGILVRARVQEGFESALAYGSPFTAVRIDQPENLSFAATNNSSQAAARITIGFAHVDPASVRITLDCVDLLDLAGATIPGGPFGGSGMVAGTLVTVSDFVSDLDRGVISFTLLDLPGGAHKLGVSVHPDYLDELPLGYTRWGRPLGTLKNERTIAIFRAQIDEPTDGASLPFAPVVVRGTLTHGLVIEDLRVHGIDAVLPPEVITPATECLGEIHTITFDLAVPTANVTQDIQTGDDPAPRVDPGNNFLSIIATDVGGLAASDRARVTLGTVFEGLASGREGLSGESRLEGLQITPTPCPPGTPCGPVASVPDHVTNGLAVSLSTRAIDQSVRGRVLPDVRTKLAEFIESLEGKSVNSLINACPDGLTSTAPPPDDETRVGETFGTPSDVVNRSGTLGRLNAAPVFNPPIPAVHQVERTKDLAIPLSAEDADGDAVTFSLGVHPANSEIISNIFRFTPTCDQLGSHNVEFFASDGVNQTTATTSVDVIDGNIDIPFNIKIKDTVFDANTLTLAVSLPDANSVLVSLDTGPVRFDMGVEQCFVDCLFCCCCGLFLDFSVSVSNIHADITLTPQQLACGLAEGETLPVVPDVQGATLDFGDPSLGCLSCFIDLLIPGGSLFLQIGNLFDVQQSALDDLVAPLIEPALADELEKAIEDNFADFGGDLAGVLNFVPNTTLPPSSPVDLGLCSARVPVIEPTAGLSLGLHSQFLARTPIDPAPAWVPTPSGFATAAQLGGDVLLEASDDAINQLLSELTSAGLFRQRFDGFTLGTLAAAIDPSILDLLAPFGITASTPVAITLDLAQDLTGNSVPPIMGFVDDPNTPNLELKVRVQALVRAIIERGTPLGDDRNLCSCLDLNPACIGEPCLISETLLKMNFLVECMLLGGPPETTSLRLRVTDIQNLARSAGFDANEVVDLASTEDEIVDNTSTSPLLATVQTLLNANLPDLDVPNEALTLDGFVSPINLRLVSRTVDDAGLGIQDYIGFLADVPPAVISAPASQIVAGASGDPRIIRTAPAARGSSQVVSGVRPPGRAATDAGTYPATLADARPLNLSCAPNPFVSKTTIRAVLARPSSYRLTIFDVAGKPVRTFDGFAGKGIVQLDWDGTNSAGQTTPPGMYFSRLSVDGKTQSAQVIRVR